MRSMMHEGPGTYCAFMTEQAYVRLMVGLLGDTFRLRTKAGSENLQLWRRTRTCQRST